ncbi:MULTISPECIES: cytochrome c maturation protein CcmE [Persicobacter]|uniref:Cytochrome c maturation protein CcmE n=1 Tax=Persicobacter diffluens TaxID=981 RepID=A0AAN4VXT6_9BACT|nr:cytochrome c maturation protein CcmE [Persicobacter sp. CCB-QB2]GJM62009.1 hypothetical protein PEDI_25610 [Persicobacter diffluens]
MKKAHIFGIVIIAIAIMVIVSTIGDSSTYTTFTVAQNMAQDGNKEAIHVVGQLTKDPQGKVVGIQSGRDMVSFSFTMIDNDGKTETVFYNEPMPQDFARSEQVVVIGSYKNQEQFIADKILLKCPSKYKEEQTI